MASIKVTLAWAWTAASGEIELIVDAGITVGGVLLHAGRSGAADVPAAVLRDATGYGVWGRARAKTHVVRDGDRIEIYRPLTADPKEARRRRVQKSRNQQALT